MIKRFFNMYQNNIFFALFLLLAISFFTISYVGKNLLEEVSQEERGNYLLSYARILEAEIPRDGYMGILKELGLENASKEEQIKALNSYFFKITDSVSKLSAGLGVGYYSKRLDAILTYGPSSEYAHLVGVRINASHPGYVVMNENTRVIDRGEMVRGEILNAMLPIERRGEVIGYVWANQLSDLLDAEFANTARKIDLFLAAAFCIITFLLVFLAAMFNKDIAAIIGGLENIKNGNTNEIMPLDGKLGVVVSNINELVDQLAKAKTESAKITLDLQKILDNINLGVLIYDTKKKELVYANSYTKTHLALEDIQNETFSVTFYHSSDFSLCPCYNIKNEPNFDVHQREFYLDEIKSMVHITERLITWHDGRVLLMLSVAKTN